MIQRMFKCKSVLHKSQVFFWALTVLIILMFNVSQAIAQDSTFADLTTSVPATTVNTREFFGGKITNIGYGGPVIKFSRFNNQFALMTGGRGAATINNRYTIGGGGYGIANSVKISGSGEDTSRLFKMGYGGIELGYILLPGEKVNIGTSLLIAGGASFLQNRPKSKNEKLFDDDFKIFPVLEPLLFGEIDLTHYMRLYTGLSYRYVHNAHLDYITDHRIRGFSCYIGLLFGN